VKNTKRNGRGCGERGREEDEEAWAKQRRRGGDKDAY